MPEVFDKVCGRWDFRVTAKVLTHQSWLWHSKDLCLPSIDELLSKAQVFGDFRRSQERLNNTEIVVGWKDMDEPCRSATVVLYAPILRGQCSMRQIYDKFVQFTNGLDRKVERMASMISNRNGWVGLSVFESVAHLPGRLP